MRGSGSAIHSTVDGELTAQFRTNIHLLRIDKNHIADRDLARLVDIDFDFDRCPGIVGTVNLRVFLLYPGDLLNTIGIDLNYSFRVLLLPQLLKSRGQLSEHSRKSAKTLRLPPSLTSLDQVLVRGRL